MVEALQRLRADDVGSQLLERLRVPVAPRHRLSLYELIYYPSLFVWLVLAVFGDSAISGTVPNRGMRIILTLAVVACYALLVFKPTRNEVLLDVCVAFLAAIAMKNGLDNVATSVLMAWCANRVDLRVAAKVSLVALLFITLTLVTLSQVGVIPDLVYGRVGSDVVRHCLGFGYTTYLSHYWLAITMLAIYLKDWRPDVKTILFVVAGNVAIYMATDSRNSFLLVFIALLVCCLAKAVAPSRDRLPGWAKVPVRFVLAHSITLCALLSVALFMGLRTGTTAGDKVNSLTTNRVHYTQLALDTYGVKPLGQDVNWSTYHYVEGRGYVAGYHVDGVLVESPYCYVDNSVVNLLITWGVLPTVLMLVGFEVTTSRLVRTAQYGLAATFLLFGVHSILDPQLVILAYTPFLPFVGTTLLGNESR